jgi:high affinity Mn2+ porin
MNHLRTIGALALAAALLASVARADEPLPPATPDWWRIGGQVTAAAFAVPRFHSPYANPDVSFGPGPVAGWSFITTLYAGVRPWEGALLVLQPEFADGAGLPNVSGISGYIDGNIIRVSKVGKSPYAARLFFQQFVALGPISAADPGDDGGPEDPFMPAGGSALGRPRPESRVELTAGKFAATDFFDLASATSDPRHRFMNWSLMTNGAWDFAADTRGYTWGLVVALERPRWAIRAGLMAMPTTPNGPVFDGDLAQARSETVELEFRYQVLGSAGAVKWLGYANHGRMGAFQDALAAAPPGAAPSLDAVARRGALKYGTGLLVDQRIGAASAFLRASWNDGRTEEFAFTQIEHAVSLGAELPTDGWGRAGDHVGAALALNGLVPAHVRYLQAGGVDFQLGDGRLRYAVETVFEACYALHLGRNMELTADLQVIANPGMNADRGPAFAAGLRLHAHL